MLFFFETCKKGAFIAQSGNSFFWNFSAVKYLRLKETIECHPNSSAFVYKL